MAVAPMSETFTCCLKWPKHAHKPYNGNNHGTLPLMHGSGACWAVWQVMERIGLCLSAKTLKKNNQYYKYTNQLGFIKSLLGWEKSIQIKILSILQWQDKISIYGLRCWNRIKSVLSENRPIILDNINKNSLQWTRFKIRNVSIIWH